MATLYWGGNGHNWNDTTKWYSDAALTVAAGVSPTNADHVFFNENAPGNCVINTAAHSRTMTIAGFLYKITATAAQNLEFHMQGGDTCDLRNIGGVADPIYSTLGVKFGSVRVYCTSGTGTANCSTRMRSRACR